ncbi:hypothetical protein [Nocardia sp. CY41]|uniref:hypothetical protein n=1 Tax=Nocardia sp. CY41 TaxID=2608686 RepID=UPI001357EAD7|nr:hypothetical protein [Nocardia sp. CY41]
MATFTGKFYGLFFKSLLNKEIDFDTDNIKIMLCTNSYTFDQDTHQYKSSITNEVSGTGYTAGGQTLTSVTVTYDAPTNTIKLDAADPSWTGSTLTGVRKAVIYDSTPGTDATRPLIAYLESDADLSTTSGTLSITFDAAGIATVTVAA